MLVRMRRAGSPHALVAWWRGCKMVQPLWKAVWRVLERLKPELPCDPAIPLPDIYLKDMKSVL